MRDLSGLPHAKMRAAIFWILFLSWPAMRVTRHVCHPQWLGTMEDIGAIVTATAWLYGKLLFQDAQRETTERLNELGERIDGWARSLNRLQPGLIPPRPRLAAVPAREPGKRARGGHRWTGRIRSS